MKWIEIMFRSGHRRLTSFNPLHLNKHIELNESTRQNPSETDGK